MSLEAITAALAGSLKIQFPGGAGDFEQLFLRWIHFGAGITWAGLLYFFNLVNVPFQKELDAATKGKVVPLLMPRHVLGRRWSRVTAGMTGRCPRKSL